MQSLHNAMIGIGYALIVLFFAISLFKNTANFHELKRPEAAVHYLIRFVAAKTLVGYGMDIMLNIFSICNGVVSDMAAGMGGISQAMVALPGEVQAAIENVGFLASIPLWLVTILGSLFITVLSFVMILTVYGRFFRLYMYTALAPLPLASFAGESTQSVGISFIRNAICEGDQQVFMVLLSVAFFADTPDELRQETDALQSAASNFNCRFTEMRFQQENCFNTAMPYGLRRVESSHMMLTRSVTALVPFVAQEVQSPQGIFYGRNAITGNLIVGDRTKLINGNAMVIATSGSGKSMSVKMEIIMEFLRWPNARFILVDPENEYELLVKALGGEAIKVSVDSRTHFNPLDYHYDPKTDVPPDVAKIEFVLSMLDKLIGENGHLQPEDRSLIAASLKNIYKPLIASGYTAPCPTLGDLYRDLNKSNLRRAKQLALMLDVFANGSLQAFSHTTNVDMNNRLICFNIQSLGDQLRPIAMMSLLEFINMQVMTNRRKDATAATWIYFDEIHVLLKDPMSSNFLYSSWKRFRKYNAYATGISQDIQDYLDNPVAYALLSNSEFVIMLRQSKSLEALERLYGLSKPQLEFLRNASEGHGIIKMGNSMIPFSNLEPKDTAVYKLITTKPGEATAEK